MPAHEYAEAIANASDHPEEKQAFLRLLLFAGEEPCRTGGTVDGIRDEYAYVGVEGDHDRVEAAQLTHGQVAKSDYKRAYD